MRFGTRSDAQKPVQLKLNVDLVRTVEMAGAIILQYDYWVENTDLYTVKEKKDYHGSWIDQASYFGYD